MGRENRKGKMAEERCKKCGRLLFRGEMRDGVIEIKCPKCGYNERIIKKPHEKLDFVHENLLELSKI